MSSQSDWCPPSHRLIQKGQLIKQGAEGRVYSLDTLIPEPIIYWPPAGPSTTKDASSSVSKPATARQAVILKHRFPKQYRHPTLDKSLTRTRLSFEARALARCTRAGVVVPRVLWVDPAEGVLGMEKIDGWSVRDVLGGGAGGEDAEIVEEAEEEWDPIEEGLNEPSATGAGSAVPEEEESEGMKALRQLGVSKENLMSSIGAVLAQLHLTTIIHGDLTTSNMMVRLKPRASGRQPSSPAYEIVLIDFGLSSTAQFPEHYAVDLYVLERAFASTHPASEALYAGVLEAYAKGLGQKKWAPIEQKLKDVRQRGRKRDMTG